MNCFDSLPVIFVIIPVYKAEKYIAQAMDSVLGQPYKNIRIVCVDDGSPDDSISILRDYEKRHENIHVIRQENGGVSKARNTGIDYVLRCCGERDYLTFLDADDLWAKNATAELHMDIADHPDCIGYRHVRCTEDLRSAAPSPGLKAQLLAGGTQSLWCHMGHPFAAVLYSCQLLRNYSIRFVENLSYAEDSIFRFTCFYLAEQVKLVDRVLYCYRINLASAMHRRKYGTEYMPPIIRGYLKTAEFLRPYENERRGSTKFCHIMAGVHAIEMVEEHYQKFRSNRIIEKFLSENPDISEAIRQLNRNDLAQKHQKLYDEYHTAPMRFRLRCRLSGICIWWMDVGKKIALLMKIWQRKRFPMSNKYL